MKDLLLFSMLGIIILFLMEIDLDVREYGKRMSTSKKDKYYLSIPDSPKVKAWLEIDYISNDTVFCNWYANGIKTKLKP